MKNTLEFTFAILRLGRPVHWVKNFALFAAITLTGTLTVESYFISVFWAFIAFNFITSATYIFNDVLDAPRDRLHPIKKNRPIAAGIVDRQFALLLSGVYVLMAFYIAHFLNPLFLGSIITYFVVQILYSLGLKKIAIIDIIIIAFGFILRVYAGAFVIDAHLSVWFLLTVISVALFLASGKRRAELAISPTAATRESLQIYTKELLNSYVTMFGNAAWISWSLYTFFESPSADFGVWLFLAEISKATTINKLLMITIPLVIFIIMRYEAVIFADKSEAPEKILLRDKYLVGAVALWTAVILYFIYGGVVKI